MATVKTTLQSKSKFSIIDLISEGEILGLVSNKGSLLSGDDLLKGVYFDNIPVKSDNGISNYSGVTVTPRTGTRAQAPIPGFSSVESVREGTGLEIKTESGGQCSTNGTAVTSVSGDSFNTLSDSIVINGTLYQIATINSGTSLTLTSAAPTLSNKPWLRPTPYSFDISTDEVSAVRVTIAIPSLVRQGGSLTGSSVQFEIGTKPSGGQYTTRVNDTIIGKSIGPYQKQYTVPIAGTKPVTVKVTRVTETSTDAQGRVQNKIAVSDYTEIQEARLSYPDSAIIGVVLDSEQLGGRLPTRSYDIKGIKVLVPTGYNPSSRTYPTFWDGTFTRAWSDNPAWVLYDILTNKRYGLGDFISPSQVDKYGLYTIAKYCDEQIPMGFGDLVVLTCNQSGSTVTVNVASTSNILVGNAVTITGTSISAYSGTFVVTDVPGPTQFKYTHTTTGLSLSSGGMVALREPRFTFNTVITDRRDAFEVVNAIASVFRGMSYWSSGAISVSADSPKSFTRLVVPADVVNGDFNYTGSSLKSRHTAVMVAWNDPSDNYKQAIEVVEDQGLITKYGFRPLETVAFACTSRGQANRVGRWILDSEKNETETITFTGGFDFADVRPGEIVGVADPSRQGPRLGGRVMSYTQGSTSLQIDAPFSPVAGDAVYLMTVSPGGVCSTSGTAVTGVSGQSFTGLTGTIVINGVNYSILSVTDATHLTLNDSAGTQTNVKWLHPFTADRVETINLVPGTTGTTLTLATAPLGNVQPDAVYIIRSSNVVPETWRVISVSESERNLFSVTGLKYDGTKFARIEAGVSLTPPPTSFLPTGPLLPPTNLTVMESLYRTNDPGGTTLTLIDIGWTASNDPRVLFYQVQAKPPEPDGTESTNNFEVVSVSPSTAARIDGARAIPGIWSFRVAALSTLDNSASQASFVEVTKTIVGKTEPPPDVEGFEAIRDYDTVTLTWSPVSAIDLSGYDIRIGSGSWEAASIVVEGVVTTTFLTVLESTENKTYLIRARDELGKLSVGVTSVTTNYPTIPAITGLMLFQIGTSVRVVWTPSSPGSPHIKYEIRMSSPSAVWETSAVIGRVAGPPFIATASVGVVTNQRYRIKPFVEFTPDVRVYGPEVFGDIVKFPLVDNSLLFSQEEHPSFSGTLSSSLEVIGGQLALKVGETFGTYTFVVDLGAQLRGRLFYSATALNLANDELLIVNASMLIDDADFPITPVSGVGVPNVRYFLESFTPSGSAVEFFEADYDFETVTIRVEFRRETSDDFRPALSALTVFFNDFVTQ